PAFLDGLIEDREILVNVGGDAMETSQNVPIIERRASGHAVDRQIDAVVKSGGVANAKEGNRQGVGFNLGGQVILQQARTQLVLRGKIFETILGQFCQTRAHVSQASFAASFRKIAPAVVVVVTADIGGIFRFVLECFFEVTLEEILDGSG